MSPDGRLRMYFGKNANPMALHVFGYVCLSPRHARAERERDIIAGIDIIAAIIAADAPTRE